MSSVVAIVKSIVGQVIAVSPEGIRRVLIEGDRLLAGEQVLTGVGGAVTLELADGRTLDLGRDTQWSADAPDSTTDLSQATAQAAPSVEELQQAISAGLDPTTELEATAAGPTAAGAGGSVGGGHSFVMLDETAGVVDPTIGFPTAPIGFETFATREEVGGIDTNLNADQTVTAVPVATGLTLTGTPTITEAGGVIVYTATVGQPPLTDLTITLSNGQVIVISAGQTTGTVSVTIPPNDTPYIDGSEISTTITGTSGGGGLIITPNPAPAVTQIVDTIDTTTVAVTAQPAKEGDANITFEFQLSNPPQAGSTTTLTVNVGGTDYTVTVDANGKGTLVIPNTNGEDAYKDPSSVTATVTAVNGGNFEAVDLTGATTTATVEDTVDTTTVAVSAEPAKEGDANITFNFQLSNPPQAGSPTTLTVNVGGTNYTVQIDANGKGTLQVPNTNGEDAYKDPSSVTATVTAVNGGNFEGVDLTGATTNATVEDTVDTTTVAVSAEPAKEGDANITFNFQLSNPPQAGSPTTLTVNVGGTVYTVEIDANGKGTLQVPNTNGDDVYIDPSSVTASVTAVNGGNFEGVDLAGATTTVTVEDTLTPVTAIVTANPVNEGQEITFNFQMSSAPKAGSDPVVLTYTFNGQQHQITLDSTGHGSLTVANPNGEDVYVDGGTLTLTVDSGTGGGFEKIGTSNGTVVVSDTETPVTAIVTANPVNEGQDITFNFAMSSAPKAGSDPVVLTYTFNGQQHQITLDSTGHGSLTVANPNGEDVYVDGGTLTLTVDSGTGGGFEKIGTSNGTVVVSDTETPVTAIVTANPVNEGQDITFNFQMSAAPKAGSDPVVLTYTFNGQQHQITLDDKGHGSLTVANPNGEDVYVDGGTLTLTVDSGTGGGFEKIGTSNGTVVVSDTETPVTAIVTASPVNEGQDITFNFAMSSAPKAGSDPVVLTYTFNGQQHQITLDATGHGSLTVANPNGEDVYVDGGTLTLEVQGGTGGGFEKIGTSNGTVVVSDTETPVTAIVTANPVNEGQDITFNFQMSAAPKAGSDPVVLTYTFNGQQHQITLDAQGHGSLTVANPNGEDVYVDGGTLTLTVDSGTGGGFEKIGTSNGTVVVSDTETPVTAIVTANPVNEGQDITFNFAMSAAPKAGSDPVILTYTFNGQQHQITLDDKGHGSLTVANPNGEDVYVDGGTLTLTVDSGTGGGFEKIGTSAGTVQVNDTETPVTAIVTASPVNEGQDITFNFAMSSAPKAGSDPVVLTYTFNGQQHQITLDATGHGSLTVANPNGEDVYVDGGTLTLTVDSGTGGGFEKIGTSNGTVVVSDTETPVTAIVTANPVNEGQDITFNFQMSAAPKAGSDPVVLTYTFNGQQHQITLDDKGHGSLTVANPNGEDVYVDGGTLTLTVDSGTGGGFEKIGTSNGTVVVSDTETPVTAIVTANPVNEGQDITFNFQMSAAPKAGSDPVVLTYTFNGQQHQITLDDKGHGSLTVANPNGEDVYVDGGTLTLTVDSGTGGGFEKIGTSAGTVVVSDTETPVTAIVTANPVNEGQDITFNFQMSAAPKAGSDPVVLTYTFNGQQHQITLDDKGHGSLTVANPNGEDVYVDGGTLTLTVDSGTGGGFEKIGTSAGTVVVSDTETPVTAIVTASPVNEGQDITFNFAMSAAPKAGSDPVVLTYTFNGQQHQITLDDKGHGSLTVANPNGEDVYVDAGSLTLTVDSGTGGGFEKIGTSTGTVVVSDTETPVTAIVTANPVNEGQDITFNFQMSDAPKAGSDPVVLTYTFNGQQHQITLDDKGHGSLTVANPNGEDVYVDGGTLTLTVDSGTGGGFEKIGTSAGTVQVNDTETPVTAIVTANPVNEGQDITFNFQMSAAPKAGSDPVVLTYTFNGQQHQITLDDKGHGSLTVANPNGEDVYVDGGTLTLTVDSGTGGGFEKIGTSNGTVVVSDTETPVTAIVTANPVNEGQDITFNFQMSAAPKAGSDPVVLTYTFNGQQHQITLDDKGHGSLTVANPNGEDVYVDGGTLTLTVDSGTGGGFEKIGTSNGTVVVSDTETPVTAIVTANPVNEGQDITFNFQMSAAPKAGSDPVVLTYTFNGQQHQITLDDKGHGSLTVANPNGEDVYVDGGTLTLTVDSGTGGGFEKIGTSNGTVVVSDTETPVTAIVTANPVNEGQDITFNFAMSSAPKAGSDPVVLTYTFNGQQHQITLDDKGHGSLTVANPNGEDVYVDGGTLTLTVDSGTGGGFEKIGTSAGTVQVNDTETPVTAIVTANPVNEGQDITFNFAMSAAPKAGSDPVVLTYTFNGQQHQITLDSTGHGSLTVANPNGEDVYVDGGTLTLTVDSGTGGGFEKIGTSTGTVVVSDTETPVTAIVTANPVNEGQDITFNFQMSDAPKAGSDPVVLTYTFNGQQHQITLDDKGHGSLTVANPNGEDVYVDGGTLTLTVDSGTGGGFEKIGTSNGTVVVSDTETPVTAIVTANPVNEGQDITFNFQMSSAPKAGSDPVVLTYTFNGQQHQITLDAQGHGSLTVANPNGEDVYVDGGTLTLTVDSGTGGGFEKIGTSNGTVVVSDTETPVTAIVTANPVNEGQDITFNFAMSSAPKAGSDPVVLTYTFNGQQHQITLDATGHGSLTVANPNGEDVYVDGGTLTLTVDSGTGGGFEKIGTSNGTVVVSDTETPVTAIVTANPVNEGQDITFNFQMSAAPKAGSDPVVLTYTFNGQQHQITLDDKGHGSLTVANPNGEDVYVDGGTLTLTVDSGTGGGFEKIGTSNGTVVVSDTETPVTAIVTANPVNEGQDITFNFAMSSAPKAGSDPVVLTYTFNGQQHQITLDDKGHGSLTVANPNGEDVYVDAGTLTLTVDSGTGGGFEKIGTSNGTVQVNDTETPVTAIVTANPVNEGQDITFNFAMSSAPKAGSDPVVLTYTFNGQQHQITLDATGHGSLTVANPNGEDVYVDAGSLTLTVDSGTGGGFEKIGTSAGTVVVSDTETPVTAIVTANPVNEGQDITFNFQMSSAPKAGSDPVVLTYTFNGQQHQITLDDKGHGSLTVANPNGEDVYVDAGSLTLTVDSGTGGGFEKIGTSAGTVQVNDTETPVTAIVTANPVNEGQDITFNFAMSSAPKAGSDPVVLTYTFNGQQHQITLDATGHGSLTVANPNGEDVYVDAGSLTLTVESGTGGGFEKIGTSNGTVVVSDTETPVTAIVTASPVNEGQDITFNFAMSSAPKAGSDPVVLTYTFNGQQHQITLDATGHGSLTVANPNGEDVYVDAGSLTLTVESGTGGGFEQIGTSAGTVQVNDTETPVTAIVTANPVNEGQDITFNFQMSAAPKAGSDPVVLTYTFNGQQHQITLDDKGHGSLTVANPNGEDVYVDAGSLTLTVDSGTGGGFEKIGTSAGTVQVNDTETPVTAIVTANPVNEGQDITFNFQMSSAPKAGSDPVVLTYTFNGQQHQITLDSTGHGSLTVANPNGEDVYVDGGTLTLTVDSGTGGGFEKIGTSNGTVVVSDTETPVTAIVTANPVNEGQDITFNFAMSSAPKAGSDPVVLTYTFNGQQHQITLDATGHGSLTVANPNGEDVYVDAGSLTLTVESGTGGGFEKIGTSNGTVVVSDTETPVTAIVTASPVNEGQDITFNFAMSSAPKAGSDPVVLTYTFNGQQHQITLDATGHGSLTVANPNGEDVYVDAGSLTLTVDSGTGGGFEKIGTSNGTVVVSDTETPVTAIVTANPVNEGQDITFNFAMSSAPKAGSDPVVLTYTFNGQQHQITLDATGHGSLTVANPNGEDVYVDGGTLTLEVQGGTGGGFEKIGTSAGTVVVSDTETPVTAIVTANPVNEGQDITFNFQMSAAPKAGSDPVVLTYTFNGQQHQITLDDKGHGSLTVANPNGEDVYVDAGSLTLTVDSGTGGGFEKIGTSNGTVVVSDTETPVTAIVTANPVNEGQDITFNFAMSSAPKAGSDPVVLTYTFNGQQHQITLDSTGHGSLTVANPNGEDVYVDGGTLTLTVDSGTGGGFEKIGTSNGTVVVSDTETPVTAIVTANPVNEGQDITFNFAMSSAPKAGSDPVVLTYTFNGQQHQITLDAQGHGSLTVANPNGEDVYVDGGTLTLTVDSGTGGGFEKIGTSAGTVQVNDTETPVTAIVTASPVNEGQDITFNFQMSAAPKAGSDPVVLTYTFNGQQHQITLDDKGHGSLTVANPNGEDVYVDGGTLTLTVDSGTGGGFEKIGTSAGTVQVNDTETPVTATVTANPVNEGQDITFNFAMSSAPKAGSDPVVLTYTFNGQQHQITLDDKGHGSLTIANPNGEDVYVDGGSLTLTVESGTGGGFEKIGTSNGTVVVSDTETPVTAIVTANPVNEGQDITFNFAMSSAPKAGSDPVVLTYTFNGQQHQITLDATGHGSLTVANPNGEDVYVDAGTLTLQVQGGTGGGYEKIGTSAGTVQVNDTETPVTAIVTANPVNEGQDITFNFQMSVAPKAGSAPVVLTYTFNGQQHQITLDDKGHASLTVANPNTEDGYLDPQTLTLSVQGGTGGSYEKISPSSGTVEVRDTLNATTVAVTAHSGTEADAKVNFSFQLSTVPQEGYPATLTVKVGESLYIVPVLADGSATLAINNTNTEDFYKDSSQVTAKVVSINGGNFEATDVTGAQDTANIVDTINDTFVQVTADAAKEGDASVFFHFQLSNPPAPGSTTILKVDVGGTIYNVTVDATGKYTLAVPNTNAEDVYRDASNLTATVVSVTGGNYENVNLTGATATANIADTIDTVYAKISIVGDSSVTEGGTLTYKVELVDKSGNAVSVPAGKSVTVDLTWSGTADATDVTGNLPTSVTISGNSSNTTFQVQTFDDIKIESTETLIATINKVNDSSNVFEKVDIGSQKTATGSIVDNDKGPTFTGNDSATIVESGTAGGADVVLVLDRSGSMGPAGNGQQGSDPDGSGPYTSRLQMLKEAVKNLFDSGTVHSVFIVSFASSATFANSGKDGGWFTNLTDAYAAIDKLAASGNTNYASALNSVINNYTAPPAGGSKLVSVFMSDGVPNDASANESTWINFLNNKGFDDSYAVGFGGLSNTDKNYLEPIAWKPGETVGSITQGVNDNHVLVVGTNVSALTQALVGSVGGSATSGDVTSNASAGTAGWAANGWKLTAVEYNGVTYNLTSASDSKTIDLGNVGKLVIKGDGSYTFSGKDNFDTADSLSTVVKFTVKDANGTTASSTLTLTVTDRGDPVAKNDDHTATISSQTVTTAATTSTLATFTSNESNPWKFSSVDRDWADLSSNSVLKDNLSSWQSSSLAGNSNNQDAQRNSSNKLTLTDTNGSSYGDGQALTPVYKTGGAAGEVLSFTAVTSFASTPWYDSGTDTASWTLYKSTDGGNNWTIAQSGMIGSGSSTITTNALDANTQYRILLDVNDNTWTNSNASVTFDDFKVTVPGTSSIVWTAAAVVGSVLDNDTLGTSGETSTLSVKVNGVWVDASSAGTTVNGEYGSLVINKDGSYTYTPVASKDNIGHVDQFEYKLTQADGDTDTAHLYVTLQGAGPGATGLAPVWTSGNDNLLGTDGNDIIFGGAGNDYLTGGKGNDTLTGGSGADTFLWKAGHTGNDVITDFKAAEGDRLDLSDLLQGEKGSTIDNYLKMITVQGETVLQVSSDGKLNVNDGANHVDTTITLQGNNWSSSTINSLISGADPLIKVDSNNS